MKGSDPHHYLAFDLGAESGRAVLGTLSEGLLSLREVARFDNKVMRVRSSIHWDVYGLLGGMRSAMRLLADEGVAPEGLSVDTWGVDFALLGHDGRFLVRPHCYRDPRTRGVMEEFFERVPRERIYELTGVGFQPFNTLFQLYAFTRGQTDVLCKTGSLLFMPDVFNHLLGGSDASEFTVATTSQLFNPRKYAWEVELLDAVGLDPGAMQPVVGPGTLLGRVGGGEDGALQGVPIIATASHDTASAVAAVPASTDDWCFISSGTWSLMGVEAAGPLITGEGMEHNFSNEGGVAGTFRFIKNLPGMWLLSRCRQAWSRTAEVSYEDIEAAAASSVPFGPLIDTRNELFSDPTDMPAAIAAYCERTGQAPPVDMGAVARCVLESLALGFAETLGQLRSITGRGIDTIHVVGGGSRNRLLCGLTADACGVPVVAGPAEATATGNLLVQAMAFGEVGDLAAGRRIVGSSFTLERYEPSGGPGWEEARLRFGALQAAPA